MRNKHYKAYSAARPQVEHDSKKDKDVVLQTDSSQQQPQPTPAAQRFATGWRWPGLWQT